MDAVRSKSGAKLRSTAPTLNPRFFCGRLLHRHSEKARQFLDCRASSYVVTVLTPATTWMEGFTNHLVGHTISRNSQIGNPAKHDELNYKFSRICPPQSSPKTTWPAWSRI